MHSGVSIPITLIPGNSIIHRANPLAKMIWVVGYLILAFFTRNPLVLGILTIIGLMLVQMAHISARLSLGFSRAIADWFNVDRAPEYRTCLSSSLASYSRSCGRFVDLSGRYL